MRRALARAAVSLVALALAGASGGGDSSPTIYKWVDENGIAHYTTDPERIPANLRNRVRDVERKRREGDAGSGPPGRQEYWSVREAGPGGAGPRWREEERRRGDAALRAQRADLDGRIAELEAQIAVEEERLKKLISEARMVEGRPAPLYGDPELEELARRFPELQADLAELRAERRRLDSDREP